MAKIPSVRSIVVLLAFCAAGMARAQQVATSLELRLAETAPASGLVEAALQGSGQRIYLHEAVVITTTDVLRAQVVPVDGRFSIAITIGPEGAVRLAAATSTHTGRPLAVIVNGIVVAAPTVRDTIGSQAVITGAFTQADAERIVSGLPR